MALSDPRLFLSKCPDGAIFDEIQRSPELLSYLQIIVDEVDIKGMFILTGSQQVEFHSSIAQSLAGRIGLLRLLPMSLHELNHANIQLSLDEALLTGGYPKIYKDQLNPNSAYRNYFETYIERDVRQLINVKNLSQFQQFIRLCASRIGQLINFASLATDVGVSSHTIDHWLSVLEASYIIIRLQPYFENLGKRIVKSPKLYFSDVGLASFLLGVETVEQLQTHTLRGHLFENLVFLELLKTRLNQGLDPKLYFFRDSAGHEVDLIFQQGNELIPIEIKASNTFSTVYLKQLDYFQKIAKDRCGQKYIIYTGSEQTGGLINYAEAFTIMR